jgi:hypothetical protein
MLFAPSTDAPYLGRVHLGFYAFEDWDDSGANGREVKFDFGLWKQNILTSIDRLIAQKFSTRFFLRFYRTLEKKQVG